MAIYLLKQARLLSVTPTETRGKYSIKTAVFEEENDRQYKDTLALEMFGDEAIQKFEGRLIPGRVYEVSFTVRSRMSSNGDRYWTSVGLYDVRQVSPEGGKPDFIEQVAGALNATYTPKPEPAEEGLPF